MGSSHVVVKMTAFVTYRHDTDIFLSPATPCVTVTLVLSALVLYVFLLCHWDENGNYQLKQYGPSGHGGQGQGGQGDMLSYNISFVLYRLS